MIVTMDGQRVDAEFAPGSTLHAVIGQARRGLDAGRLVVGVARNGRALLDDDLTAALPKPVEPGEQIDLVSGGCAEVVSDALRGVSSEIARATREHEGISRDLAGGRVAEALERFEGSLRAWRACQQALVESAELLSVDVAELRFEGRPLREHAEELARVLCELRDGIAARDFVLVGDLIAYEMPPLAELWQRLLDDLADRVRVGRVDA